MRLRPGRSQRALSRHASARRATLQCRGVFGSRRRCRDRNAADCSCRGAWRTFSTVPCRRLREPARSTARFLGRDLRRPTLSEQIDHIDALPAAEGAAAAPLRALLSLLPDRRTRTPRRRGRRPWWGGRQAAAARLVRSCRQGVSAGGEAAAAYLGPPSESSQAPRQQGLSMGLGKPRRVYRQTYPAFRAARTPRRMLSRCYVVNKQLLRVEWLCLICQRWSPVPRPKGHWPARLRCP